MRGVHACGGRGTGLGEKARSPCSVIPGGGRDGGAGRYVYELKRADFFLFDMEIFPRGDNGDLRVGKGTIEVVQTFDEGKIMPVGLLVRQLG